MSNGHVDVPQIRDATESTPRYRGLSAESEIRSVRIRYLELKQTSGERSPMRVTPGVEYVVEMITCYPRRVTEYTITDDAGGQAQVPADLFKTTNGRLPSNWFDDCPGDGLVQIGPRSWVRPDFWLDYWGSDASTPERQQKAMDDYRRERELIMREDD